MMELTIKQEGKSIYGDDLVVLFDGNKLEGLANLKIEWPWNGDGVCKAQATFFVSAARIDAEVLDENFSVDIETYQGVN